MAEIIFKLACNNTKTALVIDVRLKGINEGRKRIKVEGLTNPDCHYWDYKEQCFKSGTDTARINNPRLVELKAFCNELISNECITSTEAFAEAFRTRTTPTKETFGEYLSNVIKGMKAATIKHPSRAYQVYITLLHKLEKEGTIINKPLEEISDVEFIQFGEWILKDKHKGGLGGVNYRNLMKNFKAVHQRAFETKRNTNHLDYPYTRYATNKAYKKPQSLDKEQYKKFAELDVSLIPQSGTKAALYKELYHDFCIFLYETKTRPVDALKVKASDIRKEKDIKTGKLRYYWNYTPEKKKNYQTTDASVKAPLSTVALGIIEKYKGQSSQGYVFPFAMNEYDWSDAFNETDWNAKKWNNWNNRKQRTLEMINVWLKKVADKIFEGNEVPRLTLYTFRHSAFTHACNADNANWGITAMEGGTSIKMLESRYVKN